ncbi:hypothetical protein D9756_002050 [Leucocoprinus leucothites]|uniref:Uncharacterized protein n=1 Tax=Leucocoprinus leucothites TaxID=201217 RepID=A0A8H5GBT4_9AGAR|nr:hypothetical protein D9756_002050 [Leucoagaricus leucothites]
MVFHRSCLHLPVFPSQLSTYSTLAGALTLEAPRQFTNPRRRRVPQYKTKSLPGHDPLCPPILFDYISAQGQGVPIHDFIVLSTNALAQDISGAHDQVLAGLGVRVMTLRIMWQGYERLNWSRSIPVSPALSRAQLGATIAMQVWNFIEDVRSTCFEARPEWSLSLDAKITFDNIILLGLYSIYDNIWQADLAVDDVSSP